MVEGARFEVHLTKARGVRTMRRPIEMEPLPYRTRLLAGTIDGEEETVVPYSPLMVRPMKQEMTAIGFEELLTPEDVDRWMADANGTAMLVINSVCGCAAGQARPGVRLALENEVRPDRLATVFAGQEVEATARARGHFADIPPSSPSIALFKDGEMVYFVPRHRIESRTAEDVAADLNAAFDRYFAAVPAG